MNIKSIFTIHQHYWGIPHHRSSDQVLIQTCYGCGAEKKVSREIQSLKRPETIRSEEERVRTGCGYLLER